MRSGVHSGQEFEFSYPFLKPKEENKQFDERQFVFSAVRDSCLLMWSTLFLGFPVIANGRQA